MVNDPCCVSEPDICLYVSVDEITAASGCTLTPEEIELVILGVMCDIDAYVGRTEKYDPNQEFNFPRMCDDGCIPFKLKMVATEMSVAAAIKKCSGSGGSSCGSSVDPADIKSETILGHSYTKFDRPANGFSSIPERLQKRLDDFKMRSGYLEVDTNQRGSYNCCGRNKSSLHQSCPGVQ